MDIASIIRLTVSCGSLVVKTKTVLSSLHVKFKNGNLIATSLVLQLSTLEAAIGELQILLENKTSRRQWGADLITQVRGIRDGLQECHSVPL